MEITYLGHSSFKIKGKSATVITDPFDPVMVGLKFPPQEADIVTISHDHNDHNYLSVVQNPKKVITGPGEYEVSGVSILGISSFHDDKKGEERGKNTVYVIEIDQFRIAHLGDLGHNLTEGQLGELGEIDILMIPVGGVFTIDAQTAAELAKKIDPIAILPMHYADPALGESFAGLAPVDDFIKNLGMQAENLPKLVVKEPLAWENEQQHVYILDKK